MRSRLSHISVFLLCGAFLLAATPVLAVGWGPRVGATIDPDQIHFGAHFEAGRFSERVRFRPSFELGLGDDLTTASANLEGFYRFNENWEVWSPYVGGGLDVVWYEWDNDFPGDGHSDTEAGLALVGGIEKGTSSGNNFFLEAKLGLMDIPDLKLTVGWTFF